MAPKQTRGRQKVDVKAIADESKRHVTFSKRRTGLFNKAAEINLLTGAEVSVIVFSRHGKAYSFRTPGANFFDNRNPSPALAPANPSDGGRHREVQCLMEALNHVEAEKERYEMMMMATMEGGGGGLGFWWDCSVENMEMAELERFTRALVVLRKKVAERAEAIMMMRQTTQFVPPLNGGTLGFGQDQEIRVEDYLVGGGGGGPQAVQGPTQCFPSSS